MKTDIDQSVKPPSCEDWQDSIDLIACTLMVIISSKKSNHLELTKPSSDEPRHKRATWKNTCGLNDPFHTSLAPQVVTIMFVARLVWNGTNSSHPVKVRIFILKKEMGKKKSLKHLFCTQFITWKDIKIELT